MTTFYEVLGVQADAAPDEIHVRYRELAKSLHPDAGGADRAMAELNAAWDVLGNPAARRAYDRAHGLVAEPVTATARVSMAGTMKVNPRTVARLAEHGFALDEIRWWQQQPAARPLALKALEHADFAVLPSLAGRRLFALRMTHSSVGDREVTQLAALNGLRILDLSNTHVTDRGVSALAGLVELEELGLWGADITDAALATVTGLSRLVSLNLGATRITDAAMPPLRRLPRLQLLNLRETGVTERGLAALTGVPALRLLSVPHLGVRARQRVDALLTGVRLA